MDFDLLSMKRRTKEIMKGAGLNIWLVSLTITILGVISLIYEIRIWNLTAKYFLGFFLVRTLIIEIFNLGYIKCMLKISNEENGQFVEIFYGFYNNLFKNLVVIILKQIILWVGFVLLYIPGIIAFYKLRFLYYELMSSDKSIGACFKESWNLMRGHCVELFKIDLSFVGWYVLNVFTLGIASIYVKPLTTITYAEYYDYLKGKKELFIN
ncbi:hypothetical protein C817_00370 [Dorea sp. 5-2]|nr:hypothetical protein C817_00370 [Dorea sp. 5-2]